MNRLYGVTFTVAAGTAIAAPQLAPVALEDAQLVSVRIVIPDGHNGFTGLQVRWGGTQIIPFGTGTWITANSETMDVDWGGEITAGGIVLAGYNTDLFPHSFYLRFLITDLAAAPTATVVSAQAAGPAAVDSSGVAALDSTAAVADTLPDVGTGFGDTGQAVPDLVLPTDLGPPGVPADLVVVGKL